MTSLSYITPPASASKRLTSLRARWLTIREHVLEMRSKVPAPVDHMGCHVLPEEVRKTNSIASQNLQILISLLLSSQTKDQYTFGAVQGLRARFYPDEITPARILTLSDAELDTIIHAVGFHQKKTIYMKKMADLLLPGKELQERIPTDLNTLIKTFSGVGPKMGILYLQYAQPYPNSDGTVPEAPVTPIDYGLAVDTHILRLSQQFGLVFPPAKGPANITPEIARSQLEDIIPKEQWKETNPLLVGFGQTSCGARSKSCGICTLAGTGLCKAEDKRLSKIPRKRLISTTVHEDASIKVELIEAVPIKADIDSEPNIPDVSPRSANGAKRKRKIKLESSPIVDIEELIPQRNLRSHRT
ncbi:DNA glycosylase [Lipomyces oligophaga]|uniref:DNA glycosylase n=1 Tax=Lipomyces oligophaga TaxID=45792 RepID=UPI0034CD98A0